MWFLLFVFVTPDIAELRVNEPPYNSRIEYEIAGKQLSDEITKNIPEAHKKAFCVYVDEEFILKQYH